MPSVYPVGALAPAGSALEKNHLTGEMFRGLYYRSNIPYTNTPSLANAEECAENIDAFLHTVVRGTRRKIACGHSMGAQGIYKWMRDYGPTSDIDPEEVAFISSGNMERKYGGIAHVEDGNILGVPIVASYGGNGLPDPCPWRVIDIARQYDPFADYPETAGDSDVVSQDNINKSFSLIKDNPHKDYTKVSLVDPANLWFNEGTVSYVLVPTFPLPLVAKTYWYSVATQQKKEPVLRPLVEADYDRPFPSIPTQSPVVTRSKWQPWGWNSGASVWERVPRQQVERQPAVTLFF